MIPKFLMGLFHLAFDLQDVFVDAMEKNGKAYVSIQTSADFNCNCGRWVPIETQLLTCFSSRACVSYSLLSIDLTFVI